MPVTYAGNYTKQVKLLPLTLSADGTAHVTVRYGFADEQGNFAAISEKTVPMSEIDVATILGASPTPGLTRRDDLSLAVYTWLVTNGHLEPGRVN
jgi:hypothetical protein